MYDITSLKTLDSLDRWLEELDKYDNTGEEGGMVKMVVGTKSDQLPRRQVTSDHVRQWAEHRDLIFLGIMSSGQLPSETVCS